MTRFVALRGLAAIAIAWLSFQAHPVSRDQGRLEYETAWALAGPCCGDSGHDIAVEPDGSFFIVGNYGALDLDGDGRVDAAADPDGRSEGFVAMLGSDGAVRQVVAVTGPGHDQVRGAALSPDGGTLSLTGFVRLTADFNGDGVPEGTIRCDNFGDIVWARYRTRP